MKWALSGLRLIVAAGVVATSAMFPVRGDYLTFAIASHEAMADYIRVESRSWAEGAEGEGGRLAANTTWSGGEHIILNDLYVPNGVTLTINAGTIIKFREGTRIKVEDGGSIVLNGELGNEIVLEGYEDDTSFKGIVFQSGSAGYSDNCYVIVRGIAFGRFATVNISDTEAFKGGGQALVPVNVSGSRDTEFSFDWVAETNGVQFASGTMNWSRVSDGSKNIAVPYPDGLPGCSNFTVRATTLRCCTASKGMCEVNLSEFITTQIYSHEAMADYIPFESREWAEGMEGDGGRLSSNVVWSGTHKIVSDVYIPSGVTLTLSADTVVEFCEGTRIKIEDGGKLDIVGADGHDIILRGAEGVSNFVGIVKMANGTFADNSYVQAQGWTYSAFAGVSMHDSSTFRSSGLALIPVSVSGSRSTAFSIDWVAETNGVAYKTGTMTWNNVSEGRKNITLEYGSELDGLTNFTVRVAVERACHASPDSCDVKISDFETVDIFSHETMADYIAFESREWAAGLEGEGGRLDGSATWSGTHKIVSDVYIPSGVTLTLAADAVVEFCEGTRIKIEDGGVLNIVGANGHDVIIRGAEGVTNYVGVVKMPNGTYTDNMYVQYTDKPYSAYPNITVHEATTYREAGKMWIAFSLSGTTRNQSFNVDWVTDKGDSGTLTWSSSSDGTKWIEIPIAAEPIGGTTNHVINITAARGCNVSVGKSVLTVLEPDYNAKGQVALTEGDAQSNEFTVNGGIKTQPLFLSDVEKVQYSGKWQMYDTNEAAVLRVTLETDNGATVLKEASPSETGAFDLNLKRYPVGYYTLRHEILNDLGETLATMQKTFSIADDEDVELHGGTLTQNEVWSADKVHVVYETVVVPSIYTIFIEPGAIVKFMTGTGIDISQGGAFFANRIVFTHINDDTVGGDTLSDGFTVAPPMDAYFLSGNFTFGDDTELRGITQNTALSGTISTQKMLSRGSTYRVSGTVTIASGGSLTIPPGTVLKMESGAAIVVNSGATLNAIGTRAAPIVITSIKDDSYSGDTNKDGDATIPQPGDWEEIKNNGGTMNLAHVSVLYGGYGQYSNQGDAIIRTASGETTLDCCEVRHSDLRLLGRTGGTVYAENCILEDGRWGIDGAVTFVNGVIANCNTGANGATLKNSILWECDTYASGGTASNCVAYGEITTVQAGMTYADPLFVDPANGDFRVKEGSPCVDAADGSVAPELDFYGQPRITITDHGDELVGQLADIGICEVMPRDVVSDIDLVPQSVRTTTNAVPGQLLFVKWEIANVGGREVEAAWRDTVSLVSESGREVVLGVKTTSSRIGVGGSVFCSGYFTVPAISEGTWYPKVNVNSYHDIFEGSFAANNALTGERAVSVGLEALDPSISREGVINGGTPTVLKLAYGEDAENRMVKFNVPAGVKATWGFGFMPGGTRSGASGSMTATGDGVMFRVPDGATDVYVVLESDTTATYNLSTESTQMTITGVTPATLPSSGTTTLTITGAGFGETNAVSLMSSVGRVALNAPQKDASGNLIAMVDCAALTAGQTYAVRVESGENAAELPGAVSVVKAEGKGILELEYDVPSSVRPGRVFTFTVTYRNTGNKDMCVPLLTVQDTGNDTQNPIQFSLDGERFTSGGFQFVGNDAEGGFGPLHPGDEVTLLLMAKIPPANNGSTAVSVRANTESDIMAKYTTEIDRYLTPSMKAEFAATTDAELKARGERMAQVFGANNGEMVQNFAALAKRFYECNGFVLQKVDELVPYGVRIQGEGTPKSSCVAATQRDLPPRLRSVGQYLPTGVYIRTNDARKYEPLASSEKSLANKRVAVIAHGLLSQLDTTGWMVEMGDALADVTDPNLKFDEILYVNWSEESHSTTSQFGIGVGIGGYVRLGSGKFVSDYIPDVAQKVAFQLASKGFNRQRAVFIGHSFGSHLLGYLSSYWFAGTIERHIGLDTAAVSAVLSDYRVNRGAARVTEYYRSSSGSGRNDAYADYNYMVCKRGSFDNWDLSMDPFLGAHSYSCEWFIENIKRGRGTGIGFWRDDTEKGGGMLSNNGFIGVIYGPMNKLEAIYPYLDVNKDHSQIHYPGNQSGWLDMYLNWIDTHDLYIYNVYSQDSVELVTGISRRMTLDVGDYCDSDILSVQRESPYYRLAVDVCDLDGSNRKNIYTSLTQASPHFDFDVIVPHDRLSWNEHEKEVQIIFKIWDDGMLGMGSVDLYDGDNEVRYKAKVIRGVGPEAVINGCRKNDFVIDWPQHFASYEEYSKSYNDGETFVYTYDGRGSKAMDGNKLEKFEWYDGAAENPNSEAQVFQRRYYKVSRGDYPIRLVVTDDAGRFASINGTLRVYPVIGKGKPIEQPRSYDPNEMRGKIGLGDPETQRFVKPGEELTYTIYFENKTNATAAAQEVYVTNPLSEWLDWNTFKMHEVAFGDQIDLGLVDKSSGTSEVTMKGTNFVVRTELVLESTDGTSVVPVNGQDARYPSVQARWYMRIVDPTTDTGWPKDIVAGFLPPNDETHRGEGHITYSICVREDAPANLVISNSADIVFDHNPAIKTDPAWWNTVSPIDEFLQAGEYVKLTLAELGYDVPTNGTPYEVKALGLPAGLKLKYNAAVTKKVKGKTVVVKKAKTEWWIEGVPTAPLDFMTNPPYLVITAGTAAPHAEALPIQVAAQEVIDLGELALGQSVNTNGWLTGVGAGWTVSGLPTGLKYATKKVTKTTGSGKKKVVTTVAEAYAVYGKTTKAGLFTITAKKKKGAFYEMKKYRVLVNPAPVDTALFGEALTNITTMAYVPLNWNLESGEAVPSVPPVPFVPSAVSGKVTKVTGLPTGLTFASANVYKDKKKTQVKQLAQTIVGTPTKPGTYVVTFTKNVKEKVKGKLTTVAKTAQILWVVEPNDAEVELGFNMAGGVIESGVVGLKYGDLLAFSATSNATVTASGLPAGIKLVKVEDGSAGGLALPGQAVWGFQGFTTKAGTYLVTVKATLNGRSVTQRVALVVEGLPAWAKGTFNGVVSRTGCQPVQDGGAGQEENAQAARSTNGLATVTVSSVGKISGKFYEGGTNWTFAAARYTAATSAAAPAQSGETPLLPGGATSAALPGGSQLAATDEFGCSNVVATYAYKVTETVKGKKKLVTKYVDRTFNLAVSPVPIVPNVPDVPVRGVVRMEEVRLAEDGSPHQGSEVEAWQNLWGSTYKAVGKALFTTKSGKKTLAYKTFTVDVYTNDVGDVTFIKKSVDNVEKTGLTCFATLSLKVTTAGAVTATLTFDTGKTKKDPKTKRTVKVYYKPTCQTVVIPTVAADAEPFMGEVHLFFAPSPANNFPGWSGVVEL